METIKGIAASKGISIGNVLRYTTGVPKVTLETNRDPAAEIARFEAAVNAAVKTLGELHDRALKTVGEQEAMLFDIHAMMLQDLDYMDGVKGCISEKSCNAEYAVMQTGNVFAQMFAQMDDEYMRAREADVRDVSDRVLRVLAGTDGNPLEKIRGQVIVAAEDLMPSETIQMDTSKVLAFATKMGSKISHSAILARTMGIPAVVGLGDKFEILCEHDVVIVDGSNGDIILEPDEATLQKYRAERDIFLEKKKMLKTLIGKETVSMDGKKIEINANIGHPGDIASCIENDAEGIGLFRSEFLYMESSDFPSEDVQYMAYREILEKMKGKRVIVRTLDLGADKHAPYFKLPHEENPAMGYRAIRICLAQPEIFKTQLRALHRASVHGRLAVMFPMVVSLYELQEIKKWIETVKEELKSEGVPYSKDVEYGVMIETPAAVLVSDQLAKEVDFFSIGTNDLTQYTLACDRMNANLSELYDPRSLSVLRMIALTVRNAHREGIWVGICGESAADTELTGLYLKLGVDELSVSPVAVLEVRNKVLHTDSGEIPDDMLNIYMIQ